MASIYKESAERIVEDAYHLKGCELTVLTEDFKDQIFWEAIIEHLEPKLKSKIDFITYSKAGARGKSEIAKFKDFVNQKLIICVDSDCEHLYNPNTWIENKYVYHTNVYSLENIQSNPTGLSLIVREMTTLNYDFETFLTKLSEKLQTLFYFWIYIHENNLKQFNEILNNEKIKLILELKENNFNCLEDEEKILQNIENKVNDLLIEIKNSMGESWYDSTLNYDIPTIKEKLETKFGITKNNIYCFIYGHALFEQFILQYVKNVAKFLKDNKIKLIEKELILSKLKDRDNALNHFRNIYNKQDIITKLEDNYKYPIYKPDSFEWIKFINNKMKKEMNFISN